ncbi:MAG: hypothetical protein ABR503_12595 [Chitinophagaceae bacterium]
MKKHSLSFFLVFVMLVACSSNNTNTSKQTDEITSESSNASKKSSSTAATQGDGIIGEWQLTQHLYDANGNKQIDEEERKKPLSQAKDYLKLNSDGTCLFYMHKLKGRYEIKTQASGKKILYLFDKDNNKENRGQIVSVSKTELILLNHSSGSFSIYKRV